MRGPLNLINLWTAYSLATANFTAVAATDIITSATHGRSNGDIVWVSNSGGGLPGGLSTQTKYYVRVIDTNTFYLATQNTDDTAYRVNITSAGTGTQSWTLYASAAPQDLTDFTHIDVQIRTASSFTGTIKFAASIADDAPDFAKSKSATNQYSYLDAVPLNTGNSILGSEIVGDTGIALTGTDIDSEIVELNINGIKWFAPVITSWTQGTVTIGVRPFMGGPSRT